MQTNEPESDEKQSIIAKLSDFLDMAKAWCEQAWNKVNDLTQTNYELGFALAQQGRVDDAIWRFRITLWLAPNHEPTLYNLACLYHHKGLQSKALALFSKIIKANPTHRNAVYMVASINPDLLKTQMRPTSVPMEQLLEYFNHSAPHYDAQQLQQNYRLPAILHQLLRPMLDADVKQQNLLDVGCGTGMVGEVFKGEFANIIGVDIAEAMLDIAHRRLDARGVRIYNQLVKQDIHTYLAQEGLPPFHVVVALDVLPYIGDLQSLATQMAHAMQTGAIAAISFNALKEDSAYDYSVTAESGYFGHKLSYVERVMKSAGLQLVRRGEVEARSGQSMQLCFFSKGEHTAQSTADSGGQNPST